MTVDILCKVVDNYGDIGVVYRLARALTELDPSLKLRLVVDDLEAFHRLCPRVNPAATSQSVDGWTVVRWDSGDPSFAVETPRRVIECFACGRPPWFEDLLFDETDPTPRLIVDLEYLTAEPWAEEFHLLPSATRSRRVRKVLFMPGFAPGTGGLIQDRGTLELRAASRDPSRAASARRALLERLPGLTPSGDGPASIGGRAPTEDRLWILVFSYEGDFGPILRDLASLAQERPLLVLVAPGRSSGPTLDAWEALRRPFPVLELPFLDQETWDGVLLLSDFSIVRGEESLSRAVLGGRPFLWHAYPQEKKHHLVKVRALLDRMRPHFRAAGFGATDLGAADRGALERLFLAFNDPDTEVPEGLFGRVLRDSTRSGGTGESFTSWSEAVLSLGNLAAALLTFLRDFR